VEGVLEVDIVGEHSIENPEGLNGLERMVRWRIWSSIGKIGTIPPPRIVSSGVRVIRRSCIEIVKGIGLFNGKVLR